MKLWVDISAKKPRDFDVGASTYQEAILALVSGQVTLVSFAADEENLKLTRMVIAELIRLTQRGALKMPNWVIRDRSNPIAARALRAELLSASFRVMTKKQPEPTKRKRRGT